MTKIRANVLSIARYRRNVDVFIDGLKTLRCVDADEREGVAWVLRERENRPLAAVVAAKPGDYVYDGAVVDRVAGTVEIRFTLSESDPSEEEVRREILGHYQPIPIQQIVQ